MKALLDEESEKIAIEDEIENQVALIYIYIFYVYFASLLSFIVMEDSLFSLFECSISYFLCCLPSIVFLVLIMVQLLIASACKSNNHYSYDY